MHESAVPWQEGQGVLCLVCCASGRTDRVGVFGAVPWQEGECSSWTHQSGVEPSVVLGDDHNRGHQGLCVPRVTFLEITDVDGDPRVGSALPEMEAQDGEWFGMEQVLNQWVSCPWRASQGTQHLLQAGPATPLDPPCATTHTGAGEVTSLAQSLGQVWRAAAGQGQGYVAKVGGTWRTGSCTSGSGTAVGEPNSRGMERRHPKAPCMVSSSPAAFSHVQKHCVRSIHALECPMAAGWSLPLATAHMEPAHHVTLGPLRSSQNDSTSGSWQGAEDRQVMSSAPWAAVPAGLVPIPQFGAGCLCPRAPC